MTKILMKRLRASLKRSRHSNDPERIVPGTPEWKVGYPGHIQRYQFAAQFMLAGARVLDAGCGSGYGAAHLVDHGASLVVAIDISQEALDVAQKHFSSNRIIWLQDDCHTLEATAQYAPFDMIVCLEALEHLRKPDHFLQQVTQALKQKGLFIVSTPNRILLNKLRGLSPNAPPLNPYHHREYTAEEFERLLQHSFYKVKLWYQCHSTTSRVRLSIEPALYVLWSNPFVRLGRWIQRVVRRRNIHSNLSDLLPPHEWEIVEANPGQDVTWSFIAVCQQPRSPKLCML